MLYFFERSLKKLVIVVVLVLVLEDLRRTGFTAAREQKKKTHAKTQSRKGKTKLILSP